MKQRWTRRDYSHEFYDKYYAVYGYDPPNSIHSIVQNWSDDQIISYDHNVNNIGDGSDVGGPFHVVRRFYSDYCSLNGGPVKPVLIQHPWGPWEGSRRTPLFAKWANVNNSHFPVVEPTNLIELMALGREAISNVAPNSSSFDGATFIGELREGLPSLIPFSRTSRRRTAKARGAGDEYLNVEFGWKPLLRDYHSFTETVRNSEAILDKFEKESGKLLRRRYTWPTERSVQVINGLPHDGMSEPVIDQTNLWAPGGYLGTRKTTITSTTKRWFSGTFKYYFPKRGDSLRKAAELNKLYGTNVTPDVLWNLAPWSWAADWIGDGGTLAKNLTLFQNDNLVMPWAYLMETKSVKVEHEISDLRFSQAPDTPVTLRQTLETVCKYRLKASPYGFDVDWPDFSDKQLAILAALGHSRSS